jgi:hypothetical protein
VNASKYLPALTAALPQDLVSTTESENQRARVQSIALCTTVLA